MYVTPRGMVSRFLEQGLETLIRMAVATVVAIAMVALIWKFADWWKGTPQQRVERAVSTMYCDRAGGPKGACVCAADGIDPFAAEDRWCWRLPGEALP